MMCSSNNIKIFKSKSFILDKGLRIACDFGLYNLAKVMIKSGAYVNSERENMTPLNLVVSKLNPNIDLLKLLLDNGADVNHSCSTHEKIYL